MEWSSLRAGLCGEATAIVHQHDYKTQNTLALASQQQQHVVRTLRRNIVRSLSAKNCSYSLDLFFDLFLDFSR